MSYSPEVRAHALRLLRDGWTKVRVTALLGVSADAMRDWQRPAGPKKLPSGFPVRLRIARRGIRDRLLLMRGTTVLAVLGVRRAGAWDLSIAGTAHAKSLQAVLPVLEAATATRGTAPPFTEEPAEMPAAPTPKTSTA